ncbi:PRC-barrel domain-containing protein [Chroococcus sp. FPU101]|uniref:PRC-barrel domain-containing protein n=1 Tax=Chroococcus sp. FPU101 TaxID=1974212 RepID=UPI001A8C3A3A|nr:PRC-barrel domain-containing protein [Chroococcus sp. FPU101]GFE70209.1 hypothetical protein CFPU101_28190 [Chroococcus sp. FPU101]
MSLYRIKDFVSNYNQSFDGNDIIGFSLYANSDKIGSVDDIIVDDHGQFRYLVINTGVWVFGKKVLLPIGRARIDFSDHRVYADTLTKEQVEHLPEYSDKMTIDFAHEESVRKVYRKPQRSANPAAFGVGYGGIDTAPPSRTDAPKIDLSAGYAGYDHSDYNYDLDPDLYNLNDQHHTNLKQYQERLKASRINKTV